MNSYEFDKLQPHVSELKLMAALTEKQKLGLIDELVACRSGGSFFIGRIIRFQEARGKVVVWDKGIVRYVSLSRVRLVRFTEEWFQTLEPLVTIGNDEHE